MVNFIRPKDLPAAASVSGSSSVPVDSGTAVEKATPKQIVDAGRPIATESQAIAGTDNTTTMTPLTVRQALDADTEGVAASAAASAAAAADSEANAAQSEANAAASEGAAEDAAAAAADDAVATAADRVQTGLDATATAADRVQTGLDATATAADRVQTGLDATATAADRVQTGLDAAAAEASAAEAALYDGPKVDTFAEVAGVTAAMVAEGGLLRVIESDALYRRAATSATVFDLDYTGAGGLKWVYVPSGGRFNSSHFGPAGNGVENDRATFNKLWQAVERNGGGDVYIQKGDFLIAADFGPDATDNYMCLPRTGNYRVTCHPQAKFIRGSSYSIATTEWGNVTPTIGYTGPKRVTWTGGIFDGQGMSITSPANLFYIQGAVDWEIRKVSFKDVPGLHALDLNSCNNLLIDRCHFLGTNRDASEAFGGEFYYPEAIQISQVRDTTGGGTKGCKNVTVRDCVFDKSETVGSDYFHVAVGEHSGTNNIFHDNITVEGCEITGCVYAGVRFYKFRDSKVLKNKFVECASGVRNVSVLAGWISAQNPDGTDSGESQAGRNVTVAHNTFHDIEGVAISVDGNAYTTATGWVKHRGVKIHDNSVLGSNSTNAGSAAIEVEWAQDVTIHDNTMDDTKRGILVRASDNVLAHDNTIRNTVLEGIFAPALTGDFAASGLSFNLAISDNLLTGVPYTGISVDKWNDVSTQNNNFRSVCTETDNTRNAISYFSVNGGKITGNHVHETPDLNKNQHIARALSSCSDIIMTGNTGYAKTRDVANQALGESLTEAWWNGSPEGLYGGSQGSTYRRKDGGAGTCFYVKETSSASASGWVAK